MLQALMGQVRQTNHCDTCWKDSPAGHKQSRSLLEAIDENFLTQVTENLMRKGAHLILHTLKCELDLTLKTMKETNCALKTGL